MNFKCCNRKNVRRCYVVMLGIRFPALICLSCGECVEDAPNKLIRSIMGLLSPFWTGKILVDDETAKAEGNS